MPRSLQIRMRRMRAASLRSQFADRWPILEKAGTPPADWKGWPDGVRFAVVLTHDVEHAGGQDKSLALMQAEIEEGFVSAFNFVPERYTPDFNVHKELKSNGFEVAVHGLNHDGRLFESYEEFSRRAVKINQYLKEWDAVGFVTPAMHHNPEWIKMLNIEYDCSTFDTDPFEPMNEGEIESIFPYWVSTGENGEGFAELQYTMPQDHGLFIIHQEKTIDIWKKKVDWIVEKGGMVKVTTHPDYINFGDTAIGREEFPIRFYRELMQYIRTKYAGQYWNPLPRELAKYVRQQALGADATAGEPPTEVTVTR